MELSTYFRINEAGTGQFERTSLLRTKAVMSVTLKDARSSRPENQLHVLLLNLF